MIIYDFDFVRVSVFPDETDAPLVIDANAVPARSVALEGFEAVARRHPHVVQFSTAESCVSFPRATR
jgi:hypothetical protein